jgi:hypothetical protein
MVLFVTGRSNRTFDLTAKSGRAHDIVQSTWIRNFAIDYSHLHRPAQREMSNSLLLRCTEFTISQSKDSLKIENCFLCFDAYLLSNQSSEEFDSIRRCYRNILEAKYEMRTAQGYPRRFWLTSRLSDCKMTAFWVSNQTCGSKISGFAYGESVPEFEMNLQMQLWETGVPV